MAERRKGRKVALQSLFAMEWMDKRDIDTAMEGISFFLSDKHAGLSDKVLSFARQRVEGVERNRADIDNIIRKYARNWRLERMSAIDRNILRIAVFEIHFCPAVPGKVAINEAIEIAKEFGSEEAPAFINGILDRIFNEEEGSKQR